MRKFFTAITVAIAAVQSVPAADFTPPVQTGIVTDIAHIFKSPQNVEAAVLKAQNTKSVKFAVATIPDTLGLPIEDVSIAIADAWKTGERGVDNGIIIVFAPNDRAVRIEVGKGLDGVFPDAAAGAIIDSVKPLLRAGNFDAAAIAMINGSAKYLEDGKMPQGYEDGGNVIAYIVYAIFLLILIFFILEAFYSKIWNCQSTAFWKTVRSHPLGFTLCFFAALYFVSALVFKIVTTIFILFFQSGGSGGGSFGGRGGGFSGGGGGGFGGGGASGRY